MQGGDLRAQNERLRVSAAWLLTCTMLGLINQALMIWIIAGWVFG